MIKIKVTCPCCLEVFTCDIETDESSAIEITELKESIAKMLIANSIEFG